MTEEERVKSAANHIPKPIIKGLFEALGVSEEQMNEIRSMRAENGMRLLAMYNTVVQKGGTIHSFDPKVKAKNRAANKRARAQRKLNRV